MNNKNNFLYLYLVLAVFLSCLFININHKSTLEYNENKYTKDDKTTNVVGNDIKNIVYTDKIAVLTFHRVAEHDIKEKIFKDNEWVNDMEIFEQQMQYLYDNGYETLSSDEFYCWYKKECEFSKKTVLLTFDDGDAELYYNVLPILQKFNFKATAFIIGEYVKDITAPFDGITKNYIGRDLINEIQVVYPNIEFQSHTYGLHRMVSDKKPYGKVKSVEYIKEDFNKNSEFQFDKLAYPYGIYDDKLRTATKEAGYKLAFRFYPAKKATRNDPPYDINRIKINGFMTLDDMVEKLNQD